ncbi:hypothetical protein [Tautonia sociabilis]|uniref:Uncharacterized protein n=1 Tax=Tautonia sociabilis TaxID=2080755 RepID=A0A432MFJ0_9BACT|nr:hypothetical protein [Tautonia sociabilis]RUL84673.1 hypothetical protein TsocGM_19825 [Tautonia sociabilis]
MSRMLSGARRPVSACGIVLATLAGQAAADGRPGPAVVWSGPAQDIGIESDREPIPPPMIPGDVRPLVEDDIPPPVVVPSRFRQALPMVPAPEIGGEGDGAPVPPPEFPPIGPDGEGGAPRPLDPMEMPEDGKSGPPGLRDLLPPDPGLGASPGIGNLGAAAPGASLDLLDSGAAGFSPGTGGTQAVGEAFLPMFGDLSPLSGAGIRLGGGEGARPLGSMLGARQVTGPVSPPIPIEAQNARINTRARVFKISDNQVPRPVDRVFFTFNHFEDVNDAINRRLNSNVFNMQVQRYVIGLEKTFWEKKASLGIRLPLNVVHADSVTNDPMQYDLTRSSTALGDLFVYSKFILHENQERNFLLSGGLAMTLPVGPTSFAGASYIKNPHSFAMQPYLAYYKAIGRFYIIGFEAIDVPINEGDATVLFNDIAFGYVAYRSEDPNALIRLVAPVFEAHANIPLSHTDPFDLFDEAGTPDVVNLTYGLNIQLGRRTILSGAFVNPVTGPRPFDFEAMALLNIFF